MCFIQRFWKVLRFFPLEYIKTKNLGFACMYSRGKNLISNQEKIGENSLIVLFFLQDLSIKQKAWYETMYNFQKSFFKNICNLGHSKLFMLTYAIN